MTQINSILSNRLFTLLFVTITSHLVVSPVAHLPLHAAPQPASPPATLEVKPGWPASQQAGEKENTSQDDLTTVVEAFRRRRSEGEGVRRGPVCHVTPNAMDREIWSDRPFFVWRVWEGPANSLVLRNDQGNVVWEQRIRSNTNTLTSSQPLQPGQAYEWGLTTASAADADEQLTSFFRVMAAERRNQVAAELAALSDQLRSSGASAEAIAIRKARYFTTQNLWADALQTLYSIQTPSAAVRQAQQTIVNAICPSPGQS